VFELGVEAELLEGLALTIQAFRQAGVAGLIDNGLERSQRDGRARLQFLHPSCDGLFEFALNDALIAELQQRVRDDVGGYKSAQWIEVLDEIPSTTFQKISRVTLRQKEESES
jgi:acyl-CoA synthetase (AMP-forming)/AMP-acid ligase II